MRPSVHLALLISLLVIVPAPIFAFSSANVIASVTVIPSCSFALSLNSLASYTRIGSITMSYTVYTQPPPSCTIDPLLGTFSITQVSNGNVVISNSISANSVSSTPQTNNVVFNTNTLTNTTYSAKVSFTFNGFTNSIANQFVLLNPQNLSIVSLSAPSSVTLSSPITLQVNVLNFGQLASGPITLYVNIIGPGTVSYSYNEPSLSPFQSSIYSITLPDAGDVTGTYTVNAFTTYTVGNNLNMSNIATTHYTVVQPSSPGGGGSPPNRNPITPVPSLQFTTAPLYTPVSSGTSVLSQLGFQNTGSGPEILKLSIPSSFNNFISLSTNTLYILPGQQVTSQLFVNSNVTVSSGTYIVPITLNLNTSGIYTTQTEYYAFNIYIPSNRSIQVINQIAMTNNTNTAQGILQVQNPTSKIATNITLQTLIPLAATPNISDIKTTGLSATVTDPPGFYTITWQIPSISPQSAVYGYYTISKPLSQKLLQAIQNVIAVPSTPAPSSILKVVNIAFPTFYTDSNGTIQLYALYTGTTPQPVTFTLSAPNGVQVYNSSQFIVATPNQLLTPSFYINTTDESGTFLLNLYINTQGFNASYTLPLIVLNPPSQSGISGQNTTTTTINQFQFPITQIAGIPLPFGGIGLIIIVIAVAVYFLNRRLSKPRYRRETSEQLVRLREQIKRSEDEQ